MKKSLDLDPINIFEMSVWADHLKQFFFKWQKIKSADEYILTYIFIT